MERELGSQTEITVWGGIYDGAVGKVLRIEEQAGEKVYIVQLPDGTVVEMSHVWEAGDDMPRERGI